MDSSDPTTSDWTVQDWFARRTIGFSRAEPSEVAASKAGRTVSAILPARDEEQTLPAILTALNHLDGLIDEIVVIDSASTDGTVAVAQAGGATVYRIGREPSGADSGKGGAMRYGVDKMQGDIGVFLDADIVDFDPNFAVALLGALLADDSVQLVKGFYDRPWGGSSEESVQRSSGGGRVTELVARPLISRRAPQLAGFAQPLAGEVAFRRPALADLPFVSGYGVDIALLLGIVQRYGIAAMAQVDLGVRLHGHQDLDALGSMALQVEAAFDICLDGVDHVEHQRTRIYRHGEQLRLDTAPVNTWRLNPANGAR